MEPETFTKEAQKIASIIIAAYGKTPDELDDLEKQIFGAFLFGTINAFAQEQTAGKMDWQSEIQIRIAMLAVFSRELQIPLDQCTGLYEYLIECTQEDFHPLLNQIIHHGIDGYYCLDRPYTYKTYFDNVVEEIRNNAVEEQ